MMNILQKQLKDKTFGAIIEVTIYSDLYNYT